MFVFLKEMKLFLLVAIVVSSLFSYSQSNRKVDFTHAEATITFAPQSKEIQGHVIYDLTVLAPTDAVALDAQNLMFTEVLLNGKSAKFLYDGKSIAVQGKYRTGKHYAITLAYTAKPKQTVYFLGWDGQTDSNQIWTQGQGKYTSHWLPSFDDMTEKVEFDLSITFDKNYEVVANGVLVSVREADTLKTWQFDMDKPMSSYLLAFAIGDYNKVLLHSSSGIPLELYYYPTDSLRMEPTYRYSKEIFDFLEMEIGVPYPWQNYKQVPVRDFLYAGMENTGTTIFSDAYVIDSVAFKDRNYVNVNAHELAHQWFGNLVTEVDAGHHWLHEGFATFYALLAERELFGDSYFHWKLYESARQLKEASDNGNGEALTNPKAGSLTFYEKGAWALYMLRKLVGGAHFKQGVQNYLLQHQFKNARVDDFILAMEEASGKDLSDYVQTWLCGTEFHMEQVKKELLPASDELAAFFRLQEEMVITTTDKEALLKEYWNGTSVPRLKKELISAYGKQMSDTFLKQAFAEGNWEVRQALTLVRQQIPVQLQKEYESLLEDESYETLERALYQLWVHFPLERKTYLEKTKNITGFPNKNIRILWLALALLTNDYDTSQKQAYFIELTGYTAPKYAFGVRMMAFQYLAETVGFTDQNLKDLVNASAHHSWQFGKYARDLLDRLLQSENYKERLTALAKELEKEGMGYLVNKVKTE